MSIQLLADGYNRDKIRLPIKFTDITTEAGSHERQTPAWL